MKTIAIIQARTSSSRLPGKVLEKICSKPMILLQLERLKPSQMLDDVLVATSDDVSDDLLANTIKSAGYKIFRGNLQDVLCRYRQCSAHEKATTIVRLTGDCPLNDPKLIDEMITEFYQGGWDYLSNCADESLLSVPDGFDIEVFSAQALERAFQEAKLPSEREHVTPWFRTENSGINWKHYIHIPKRKFFRVTVDDPIDLEVVRSIYNNLGKKSIHFGIDDVISYLQDNPEIALSNLCTIRNEGYLKSVSEDPFLQK